MKRKGKQDGGAKKAKTEGVPNSAVQQLLEGQHGESYCEELGIDLEHGGSKAVYQWLCCCIVFGQRISEKTTIRAAKGLLASGLDDPKSVKEVEFQERVDALNSQGKVQRGPTMSGRLEATAQAVLEKYDGDLDRLREAADKEPKQEIKLIKEFKGFGDTATNIFVREAQLAWPELFPFADDRLLEMCAKHGLPSSSAKDIAELVDNDRGKFVRLLAAVVKMELRGGKRKNTAAVKEGGEGGQADDDEGEEEGEADEEEEEVDEEDGEADEVEGGKNEEEAEA